jgi:hypothetical protein
MSVATSICESAPAWLRDVFMPSYGQRVRLHRHGAGMRLLADRFAALCRAVRVHRGG